MGNFNDITQRKKAQEAAAQQKLFLDNILANSSNGITVTEVIRDQDGVVTDARTIIANDAAAAFVGLPKETFLSLTAVQLDPHILGSAYHQTYIRTLETGVPSILHYYLEATGRWLELTISRMDRDRMIHIFTDITSIKEAQLSLERSSQRLSTVINTTQAGFFMGSPVLDAAGVIVDFRFTLVNQILASFAGEEAQNLVGQLGSRSFAGYRSNGLLERFRGVYLSGEQQQFDFHYKGARADVWVHIMINRIGEEILGAFTDITHIKKLQLQLEQNIEELKRSNAYLGEFAHAASHDLKEPIRKISTFADRLQGSLQDRMTEAEAGVFNRMQMAAQRMHLLVEDLLTYSQMSEAPLQKEAVDLNKKLQLVLSDLELQFEEKGATIQAEPLPVVMGYRRQLQQLLQNLVSNALKYSKKDTAPRIVIRAKQLSGSEVHRQLPGAVADKVYHLIEVQDNGIGFEQQYADRIFSMFQRLHGRSEYEGTGIGLSIARKVVENHGGYIRATSTPGEGATFSFLLPCDAFVSGTTAPG